MWQRGLLHPLSFMGEGRVRASGLYLDASMELNRAGYHSQLPRTLALTQPSPARVWTGDKLDRCTGRRWTPRLRHGDPKEGAMPWQEYTVVESREAFVEAARDPEVNLRALRRRFGISPTTGYQWLARAAAGEPLTDRSRRPHTSPRQTDPELEAQVVALRDQDPCWGGRKLRALLLQTDGSAPSASTITAILRRHGRLPATPVPRPTGGHRRFEAAAPNLLWQMDFKGPL